MLPLSHDNSDLPTSERTCPCRDLWCPDTSLPPVCLELGGRRELVQSAVRESGSGTWERAVSGCCKKVGGRIHQRYKDRCYSGSWSSQARETDIETGTVTTSEHSLRRPWNGELLRELWPSRLWSSSTTPGDGFEIAAQLCDDIKDLIDN